MGGSGTIAAIAEASYLKMARELLSARRLESKLRDATAQAAARNTRIKIRDGDNLMLIVRANGGASRVLQYRFEGQRKPLMLGAIASGNPACLTMSFDGTGEL